MATLPNPLQPSGPGGGGRGPSIPQFPQRQPRPTVPPPNIPGAPGRGSPPRPQQGPGPRSAQMAQITQNFRQDRIRREDTARQDELMDRAKREQTELREATRTEELKGNAYSQAMGLIYDYKDESFSQANARSALKIQGMDARVLQMLQDGTPIDYGAMVQEHADEFREDISKRLGAREDFIDEVMGRFGGTLEEAKEFGFPSTFGSEFDDLMETSPLALEIELNILAQNTLFEAALQKASKEQGSAYTQKMVKIGEANLLRIEEKIWDNLNPALSVVFGRPFDYPSKEHDQFGESRLSSMSTLVLRANDVGNSVFKSLRENPIVLQALRDGVLTEHSGDITKLTNQLKRTAYNDLLSKLNPDFGDLLFNLITDKTSTTDPRVMGLLGISAKGLGLQLAWQIPDILEHGIATGELDLEDRGAASRLLLGLATSMTDDGEHLMHALDIQKGVTDAIMNAMNAVTGFEPDPDYKSTDLRDMFHERMDYGNSLLGKYLDAGVLTTIAPQIERKLSQMKSEADSNTHMRAWLDKNGYGDILPEGLLDGPEGTQVFQPRKALQEARTKTGGETPTDMPGLGKLYRPGSGAPRTDPAKARALRGRASQLMGQGKPGAALMKQVGAVGKDLTGLGKSLGSGAATGLSGLLETMFPTLPPDMDATGSSREIVDLEAVPTDPSSLPPDYKAAYEKIQGGVSPVHMRRDELRKAQLYEQALKLFPTGAGDPTDLSFLLEEVNREGG